MMKKAMIVWTGALYFMLGFLYDLVIRTRKYLESDIGAMMGSDFWGSVVGMLLAVVLAIVFYCLGLTLLRQYERRWIGREVGKLWHVLAGICAGFIFFNVLDMVGCYNGFLAVWESIGFFLAGLLIINAIVLRWHVRALRYDLDEQTTQLARLIAWVYRRFTLVAWCKWLSPVDTVMIIPKVYKYCREWDFAWLNSGCKRRYKDEVKALADAMQIAYGGLLEQYPELEEYLKLEIVAGGGRYMGQEE